MESVRDEGAATTSDLVRVIVLSREALEGRADANAFPTVRFFGDWCVHSRLDRRAARQVLSDIDALIARDRAGETIDVSREISALLSISKLRQELRVLFASLSVPTFLIDDDRNWRSLMRQVLTDLLHKPLVGDPSTVDEETTGWGWRAMELRLIADADVSDSPIHWEVMLGPRVRMRGLLQ